MAGQPEVITVDFEGRNILDSDFDGVKQLLDKQFLRDLQVNPTFLTNLLLSQNYVGSTLKQTIDDTVEDDEDDDTEDTVFGVTSIINLKERDEFPCLAQLRQELRTLADRHSNATLDHILRLTVDDKDNPLGLLINERFSNLPATVAKPLMTSLIEEIDRATAKGMAFNFSNVIVFSRVEELDVGSGEDDLNAGGGDGGKPNILWSNPEEEALFSVATLIFRQLLDTHEDSKVVRLIMVIPMESFKAFVAQL